MAQSSSSAAFVIRLGTSRAAQAAASRLLAAGFEDASGDRYGVAVLDALTPDAIAELRALRAAGRRFVALATDPWTANGFQAWAVLAAGADDVLEVTPTASAAVVERIERWRRVDRTLDELLPVLGGMGESTAFRSAMQRVADAALHSDAPVLLEGETGTGKELAAHLVHLVSEPRRSGEFVVLDCGAIVPSLSGSEFFGHERGAYTGAAAARAGAFELAHEGTLFLDELGELPLGLQPELLRVVQEGTFKRVGASEWRRSDFRVVSATSRDLAVDQQAGEFRSDLYHRLAAVT
ncbi:MAG: sigma-54 factor interaction domain-containing protein, partial [Phycisphaerales bacterium]